MAMRRSHNLHTIHKAEVIEQVEGKSLGFCGTSLDVENFLKGKYVS